MPRSTFAGGKLSTFVVPDATNEEIQAELPSSPKKEEGDRKKEETNGGPVAIVTDWTGQKFRI